MTDLIKKILETLDFHCQDTKFDYAIAEACRKIICAKFSTDSLAQVLIHLPDLFVIHSDLPPVKGTFYARIFVNEIKPCDGEIECYTNFYPSRIAIIQIRKSSQASAVYSAWLSQCKVGSRLDEKRLVPFSTFLQNEFRITPSVTMKS